MKKVIVIVMTCLMMLISAQAQAQVIQAGQTYYGGATLELAGSGATFVVPTGWSGQYNQREKLFDMYGPAGESLSVGYEGKSYADALAFAKKPITTSEGIVMTPVNSEKIKSERFFGEAVAYKGTALFIPVGGVSIILKTPVNKGLTISAAGLGSDFDMLSRQVGLVAPSLRFPAYEQELKANQKQQVSRSTYSFPRANGRYQIQRRTVAGVRLAGKITESTIAPPAWVKYSKGDPFKGYGNKNISTLVSHKGSGLYFGTINQKTGGSYTYSQLSDKMSDVDLDNSDGTKRLTFCRSDSRTSYRGIFIVSTKSSDGKVWKQVDRGRYQIYDHLDNSYYDEGILNTMFLDRLHGQNDAILVEQTQDDRSPPSGRVYWSNKYSFNGNVFSTHGYSQYCNNIDKKYLELSNCTKIGGDECYQKVWPERFDSAGNPREMIKEESERTSNSSSGSYDTHFGTTDSGAIIFSSPSGSMCSGC